MPAVAYNDFPKLYNLMLGKGINKNQMTEILGISYQSLTNKFKGVEHGGTSWTLDEIKKLVQVLEIPHEEIPDYFF